MAIAFLAAYLIGSIPAAWIIVQLRSNRDVSITGSNNVGALNALRVSRSPWVGIVVMILDGLKGSAAIWTATRLGLDGEPLHLQCAALAGVVGGHNFNPWLSIAHRKIAGGKGFAAGAGALLTFRPWLVPVWLGVLISSWYAFKAARGITDEAPASGVATLSLIPAGFLIYGVPTMWAGVAFSALIVPKLVHEVITLWRAGPPGESSATDDAAEDAADGVEADEAPAS